MANPQRGEVELKVGDETYIVRLSTNAIITAETLLDKGVGEIGAMLGDVKNFRLGTARALLFAGMHEKHPTLSLEDVGEIIGEVGIAAAVGKLGEAMKLAFPDDAKRKENPQ